MIDNPIDIIRDLVSQLTIWVTIQSVTDNTDGTATLLSKDTKYLNSGMTVKVIGVAYTVKSVVKDVSFVLDGVPPLGLVEIEPPKFWHGTVLETNKTLTGIADMEDKVPMVYYVRNWRSEVNKMDGANELVLDARLLFLTEDNFNEWDIDKRDEECIVPMNRLHYYFVESLRKNNQIGIIESYSLDSVDKFGVVNSKGAEKALFDTPLSGVDSSITIPIKRNYQCKC